MRSNNHNSTQAPSPRGGGLGWGRAPVSIANCKIPIAILQFAIASVLFSPSAAAQQPTFAPPPIRVAWDGCAESSFKPAVLRSGIFPPPTLPAAGPTNDCWTPYGDAPLLADHAAHTPPCTDPGAVVTGYHAGDFSADPCYEALPAYPCAEESIYGGKYLNPVQLPWIEWGVPFYGNGPMPPPQDCFGPTNLVQQKFYVYGDWRVGLANNENVTDESMVVATRLNLELDYWITATERIHAFISPFQQGNEFMRFQDGQFVEELDFFDPGTDALFFEGDFGQILGGIEGSYAPFDLPFAVGLVPLLFQNGIWMQDTIVGFAVSTTARNSPRLDLSNYDVTFFAGFDEISTDALPSDAGAGSLAGITSFIEARGGYFETGYAFVDDTRGLGRSYHNVGVSYTRRYLNLVSNSVRMIANAGQSGPSEDRTANGVLLLMENSFLTPRPYNVVPYVNFFAGFGDPQPVARAAVFGGVLFNTGILFQSDALTGYPTLDATGNETYGAAMGLDLLGPDFDHQLIVETAVLQVMGDEAGRNAPGNQYGVGLRYQIPITNAHLIRADAMHGWLDDSRDISGARIEFRWKF